MTTNTDKDGGSFEPLITSLLDTDLYKLTMQSAIHHSYPTTACSFVFTNRTKEKHLNQKAINWLIKQIDHLSTLRFTDDEISYLRKELPFLPDDYFKFIKSVKLSPKDEVILNFDPVSHEFSLTVEGIWETVTLYEIPLLSLISESYFKFVDSNWDIKGQRELSFEKAKKLLSNGCTFSEFGTRRRRSLKVQKEVMKGIIEYVNSNTSSNGKFLGTSNVMFAKEFNVKPIGTVGHEWMMGIGALTSDYVSANKIAMDNYASTVGKENVGLALTDTYGTDAFLKVFKKPYSDWYIGVRQDSGDPELYVEKISNHYKSLGYKDFEKMICFSDSLNVEKCIKYKKKADECGMKSSFGIGTNLTNDFKGAGPMNIVIKLRTCGNGQAIKISDNLGKNMGDPETVKKVKQQLGYVEKTWSEGDEEHRWN